MKNQDDFDFDVLAPTGSLLEFRFAAPWSLSRLDLRLSGLYPVSLDQDPVWDAVGEVVQGAAFSWFEDMQLLLRQLE